MENNQNAEKLKRCFGLRRAYSSERNSEIRLPAIGLNHLDSRISIPLSVNCSWLSGRARSGKQGARS
jgi:hypothetical protein